MISCVHACSVTSVVSDTLRPSGLWPARLLCSWDSPGKNSGVGCHALLQGIFPTLGLNLHLLPWQLVSLPLRHQGSLIPSMMVDKWWFSISIIPATFSNWHCTVRRSFPFFFVLSSLRFHEFSFYSMDCKPYYYFKVHIFQVWVMELPSSWLLSSFDMSSLNFEHCLTLFKGQICFFPPPSFIEK